MDVVAGMAPERTLTLPVTDVASAAWVTTGGPALPLLPGFDPGVDPGDDPPLKQLRSSLRNRFDYTQRAIPRVRVGLNGDSVGIRSSAGAILQSYGSTKPSEQKKMKRKYATHTTVPAAMSTIQVWLVADVVSKDFSYSQKVTKDA